MKGIIMNSKTKILLGVLIIGIVLVGGWKIFNFYEKSQVIETVKQTEEVKVFLEFYPDAEIVNYFTSDEIIMFGFANKYSTVTLLDIIMNKTSGEVIVVSNDESVNRLLNSIR